MSLMINDQVVLKYQPKYLNIYTNIHFWNFPKITLKSAQNRYLYNMLINSSYNPSILHEFAGLYIVLLLYSAVFVMDTVSKKSLN